MAPASMKVFARVDEDHFPEAHTSGTSRLVGIAATVIYTFLTLCVCLSGLTSLFVVAMRKQRERITRKRVESAVLASTYVRPTAKPHQAQSLQTAGAMDGPEPRANMDAERSASPFLQLETPDQLAEILEQQQLYIRQHGLKEENATAPALPFNNNNTSPIKWQRSKTEKTVTKTEERTSQQDEKKTKTIKSKKDANKTKTEKREKSKKDVSRSKKQQKEMSKKQQKETSKKAAKDASKKEATKSKQGTKSKKAVKSEKSQPPSNYLKTAKPDVKS